MVYAGTPANLSASAARKRQFRKIRVPTLFALLLAVGCYTNLPLVLGTSILPMASAIPGLILLSLFFIGRYFSFAFLSLVLFTLLAFALSMAAPEVDVFFWTRVIGTCQLFYSLVLGFTVYWTIQSRSRDSVATFFFWFSVLIILLSILEILTPLKSLVQSYSNLYGGAGITQSVLNRDANMGGYRPKLFTAETSFVAMAASYAIASYVWTSNNALKYLIGGLLLLVAFVVLRSPTVLGAMVPIAINYFSEVFRVNRVRAASVWLIPLILTSVFFATIVAGDQVSSVILHRLEGAQTGADYSVTYRTYGSWAAGIAVANLYPIFGIGLGSYDMVRDVIIHTELGFGVPEAAVNSEWRMSLNNAPSNSLVIFGYFGTALIWLTSLFAIRRYAAGLSLTLIAMIAILSMSDGGIYSPRYVVYLFMFASVARIVARDRVKAP